MSDGNIFIGEMLDYQNQMGYLNIFPNLNGKATNTMVVIYTILSAINSVQSIAINRHEYFIQRDIIAYAR